MAVAKYATDNNYSGYSENVTEEIVQRVNGMTNKQQRFIEEYLVDLNATQSAIRAGYSKKTAYAKGHRLLKNAEIQERIAQSRAAAAERVEVILALATAPTSSFRPLINVSDRLPCLNR